MRQITVSPLLRAALLLDGVVSASAGLLTLASLSQLAPEVGFGTTATAALGWFMLAYGALTGWLSSRPQLAVGIVWAIVIGNLLWVVDSVVLTFSGWIAPTTVGIVLLLGQAFAVALIAELQYLGLRRSHALAAA